MSYHIYLPCVQKIKLRTDSLKTLQVFISIVSFIKGTEKLSSQTSDQPSISGNETFSEGEVFAFDGMEDSDSIGKQSDNVDVGVLETVTKHLTKSISNESLNEILDIEVSTKVIENAEATRDDGNISTVASESVMWLAQRLGPVLACKYLSRNLLRMLALCYYGTEGIKDTGKPHRDQKIRVSSGKLSGDMSSEPVLECLSQLVGLYGDSLVVVQYLPHCWDLVSRAKRRISSSLESCLMAAAAVTHTAVPLLSGRVNSFIHNFGFVLEGKNGFWCNHRTAALHIS